MSLLDTFRIRPRESAENTVNVKGESKRLDLRNDHDLVDFVQKRWESRDKYRGPREKQWFTNIAFYLGYQYHVYDATRNVFQLPPAPSFRVRLVCNRLQMISRKIVAKGMYQKPVWQVVPATNDVEDQGAAIVGNKVAQTYWKLLNMDMKLVEMLTWMSTTGNVFARIFWDPTRGPSFTPSAEDFMEAPEDFEAKPIGLGDPCVEVCSPFEVDVDPMAASIEDARYVIHSKVRSLEYLEDRYGRSDLKADFNESENLSLFYEHKISKLAGPLSSPQFGGDKEVDDATICHTIYVAPTKRLPNGLQAVVANGKVLMRDDLPPLGISPTRREIPFVHLKEIMVPGQLYGTCALEQCIPLQSEYNKGRSQLVEIRNVMANPPWLIPTMAKIPDISFVTAPGEKIRFVYPFKPEIAQIPSIPEYVMQLPMQALKDMEDESSIHDVTQARTSPTLRSGVAIVQLQEMDDQTLAPTYFLAQTAFSKLGSWLLQLVSQNVSEERILQCVGHDRQIETMAFTGKSLLGPNQNKPGINYFDVQCQMGSQLPNSKLAKTEYIKELVQIGLFNVERDRKQLFRALELGSEEPLLNDEQLDRQEQNRENVLMLQGVQIQVQPWHDPTIHLEQLRRFQKQPEFAQIAARQPELIGIFEDHARQHAQALMAIQGPQPQAPPPGTAEGQGPPFEGPPPEGPPPEEAPLVPAA